MSTTRVVVFLVFYILIEIYIFSGLNLTFKNPLGQKILIGIYFCSLLVTLIGIIAIFTSFPNGYSKVSWTQNLILGLLFSFFITKLVYAVFLLMVDSESVVTYLIRRFSSSDAAPSLQRRQTLKQIGVLVAMIPLTSFLYGVFKGRYNYRLHKVSLSFPDLPAAFDGFKIVQISDVHSGSFDDTEAVKRGIEKIQQQQADLILFTGDMINNLAEEIEPYIDLFQSLSAPFGKYAVLGNHDYGEYISWESEEAKKQNLVKLAQHHQAMGFELLNNAQVPIKKANEQIKVVGVENWGKKPYPQEGDLNKAFAQSQPDDFSILMSHDPNHWDLKVLDFPQKVHLTLSGHTHGMQMGVEIPGFKWSPIKYSYKRWAGLYKKAGQYLYVNRGFGFIGFPGRVGIWPEITLIELKKEKN
ncbi:metallophosphoesterase [uncultured Microscilla sp.]|uniref:metallophosphoesterase n=1 Tax=uncultured Microscilla sp. TaxID=432653 RepID=UPI002603292E|nr:metallophosphoesterase [uncultured Microscilla sp.]